MMCASVVACDDARATLVILSDTTAVPAPRVVLALPFDPATLPIAPPAALPDGPLGDSVRLAIARHDSASQADVTFQRARAAANAAARALAPLDRTTAVYARQYEGWTDLADSAERLRAGRDALRKRIELLTGRLGARAPDLDGDAPRTRSRSAADSAARDSGREIGVATLRGTTGSVSVEAGEWWIAWTMPDGAVIVPAHRIELAGGVDTVLLDDPGADLDE